MAVNSKTVEALKRHFRKASKSGDTVLKTSLKLIKKRPAETALFTVLAGSILSKKKSES